VLFFAVLYFSAPKFLNDFLHHPSSAAAATCNMDMKNYLEAIYFSASTMSTIGYGVSDYYFGDCIAPLILTLLQIFASLAMNAVAFGLPFLRLPTSRKRKKTLIFSNKAVIRRFKGESYFMISFSCLKWRFNKNTMVATVIFYSWLYQRLSLYIKLTRHLHSCLLVNGMIGTGFFIRGMGSARGGATSCPIVCF